MTSPTLLFPYPVVGPPRPRPPQQKASADTARPFLLQPPYQRLDVHSSWETMERRHLAAGTVAGIQVTGAPEWASLEPAVRQLRLRLPAASIILILPAGTRDLMLTARAARAGVRAVIGDDTAFPDALRAALTCPDSLPEDVVEWLYLRRLRLSPMVASLLREIFAHAVTCPDLSSLLAHVGLAESSARFRLHKRLLPTPSRWFQAARALHSALRIQAEPRTSLLRIAHDFGYTDHSALSQLVHRAFRVRPGAVRGTLGWEWLMHRWVSALPTASRTSHIA